MASVWCDYPHNPFNDKYGWFVLSIFYSQLYINEIEQHAMSIQLQALCSLQGIHLVCKMDIII